MSDDDDVIIEMTPFIYETGEMFYFNITKRPSTNDWHNLWVYRKVVEDKSNWFRKKTVESYIKFSDNPELINTRLDAGEIKRSIQKVILARKAHSQIKGWDGFVGNVPDDYKKQIMRDSKLDQIL